MLSIPTTSKLLKDIATLFSHRLPLLHVFLRVSCLKENWPPHVPKLLVPSLCSSKRDLVIMPIVMDSAGRRLISFCWRILYRSRILRRTRSPLNQVVWREGVLISPWPILRMRVETESFYNRGQVRVKEQIGSSVWSWCQKVLVMPGVSKRLKIAVIYTRLSSLTRPHHNLELHVSRWSSDAYFYCSLGGVYSKSRGCDPTDSPYHTWWSKCHVNSIEEKDQVKLKYLTAPRIASKSSRK